MTLGNFSLGSLQRTGTMGENISSEQTLEHSSVVRRFPKGPECKERPACCPAGRPFRGASLFIIGPLTRPRNPI